MSLLSRALRSTGLNQPGKFLAKAVADPVRGVGRMARGDFSRGARDIATGNANKQGAKFLGAAALGGGMALGGAFGGGAMGGTTAAGTAAGAGAPGGVGAVASTAGSGNLLERALGYLKNNPELGFQIIQAIGDTRAQADEDRRREAQDRRRDQYLTGLQNRPQFGADLRRALQDPGDVYSRI